MTHVNRAGGIEAGAYPVEASASAEAITSAQAGLPLSLPLAPKYRTIVADPPWPMPWTAGANRKNGRGEVHPNWKRELGYRTMSVDDICALPIADLAEPDAHLYLWVPDRWLIDGDGGRVARAWGFDPLRLIIWRKKGYGLGKFPRPAHESVIVCRRGTLAYQLDTYPSVQDWKRPYGPPTFGGRGIGSGRVHSAKPDGFLDDVERASPGPYCELFARRNRLGWDTWGDEALAHVTLGSGATNAPQYPWSPGGLWNPVASEASAHVGRSLSDCADQRDGDSR